METNDSASDVPEGWVECHLGSIIHVQNGYAFPSKDYRDEGVPLIRQTNLAGDKLILDKCVFIDPSYLKTKRDFILRKGDILIGMSGSLGKICTYDLDYPALQNQRTGKIVPYFEDALIKDYLYYFLQTTESDLQAKGKGLGVSNISAGDIESLSFRLAPLAEQKRIVKKVRELLGRVKAVRESLAKVAMILKRFRQAVLAAACSGRLTAAWREKNQTEDVPEGSELPPGWHWMPIKELLPPGGIFDGPFGSNLKTVDYTYNGVRVVRLENVGFLQFFHQKETYISQEKYKLLSKHTVGAGDIIFASFIDEEVRACVLPKLKTKAIAKADCFCLRPRQEVVNRHYLVLQLVSRESYEGLSGSVHGATRPRINTTQLRNLEVRVCPLAEQQEIVHRVESMFKLADAVKKRVAAAKVRSDKLTQAILAKAFRGELVPTEAELARREHRSYEPASDLLARIKSDKEINEISVKLHHKLDHKKRSKPR